MKFSLIITIMVFLQAKAIGQKKIGLEPVAVNFTIRNAGLNVKGTMGGLDGIIIIDDQNFIPTMIEGTIDPTTIKTGIELRDKHLKKADYFNVNQFPKILMASTLIKSNGSNKYRGNFDLTIKGIKKNISIPFSFVKVSDRWTLKAEFNINRLDFGLGEESIILSNDVRIKIDFKGKTQEKPVQ